MLSLLIKTANIFKYFLRRSEMKYKSLIFLILCSIVLTLVFFPAGNASTYTFSDRTYDITLELKDVEINSTSIADGYYNMPVKLIMNNGANYDQLTVSSSVYVNSIS